MAKRRPIKLAVPLTDDTFAETVAEVLDITEEIAVRLEEVFRDCGVCNSALRPVIDRYRALVPKQEEVSPSSGEEAFEAGRREGRRASPTRTSFPAQIEEETIPF